MTLNGGTLQQGSGITPLTLTNTFRINTAGGSIDAAGGEVILTGAITDGNGPGGALTILRNGVVGSVAFDSSGVNTYSGATIIGDGTTGGAAALLGRQSNAFSANSAVTVTANSFLDVGNVSQTIGSLAGAGTVNASGIGATGTLITGGDNSSTTFSGLLSNGGATLALTKTGTGTMTLTGNNTYSGATIVNGGTLAVNGAIVSATTVNNGGTLGGTGTLGNTTIAAGGTLAPGNSIGTLAVTGDLLFGAGANYSVEVSPTQADRTDVSGTATLAGTVRASYAAGTYTARQYTILNAAGGRSGTFDALVNIGMPASISSALSYDANNVYLNLTLSFVAPGGLNTNQQNVGNALTNYFNTTGGIPTAFTTLGPNGLTQVSGETATGSQQVTFDAMNQFIGVMTDPFTAGRGDTANAMGYAAPSKPIDAFAMFTKAPPKAFEERWNVWAAGFGGSRTTDGNAALGSNYTTSNIYGAAVGADYWFSPATVAGFAMAGGGTNFSVANGGSGRSDLMQAGAFVRHSEGSAYVTAAAAYGWQSITTDRLVSAGVTDRLQAAFNANAYSGRVEVGNRWLLPTLGGVGITPYAAVQVTAFDLPAYAETSATGATTFGLTYAGKTVTDTRTELGLRTDKSFAVNDALLTLRGRAAWVHDFNTDRSIAATFQSLPGAGFTVNGAQASRNAALTSASAEVKWGNGWAVAATFDGEFSDTTRSYAGRGVVRYAW
ncbi:autotransporter outer membrane beta-barrel domain-containing protein [Tardiphaga alba]|uniref:autotransporter outer membrane beta-barrel domain-containing protein n=1 Tax=Tardiphaga alba TaxID=340268 RepID=UPI0020124529|nr:autotransporter domain-containing protein [Tardiphaga alba]